jgi:hypothetical protein
VLQEVARTGTTELAELSEQDRQEYFHHLARLPAEKDRQRRRNVSSVILDTAEISGNFFKLFGPFFFLVIFGPPLSSSKHR